MCVDEEMEPGGWEVRWLRYSLIFGALVWGAQWGVGTLLVEARLLLLAPFVTVPLALMLVRPKTRTRAFSIWRAAVITQPLGALCGLMSFMTGTVGWGSAAWTFPWMGFLSLLALLAFARFWERKERRWAAGELGVDAGLAFVTVGGIWWILDRANTQPADFALVQWAFEMMGMEATRFPKPIVLLTAVHFHYAGFAAPIIAGLTAESVRDEPVWSNVMNAAVVLALLGIPLTAVGITVSPWMEALAAWVLAAGLMTTGVTILTRVVPKAKAKVGAVFLSVAGVSILISMGFAAVYAYGEVVEQQALSLFLMVLSHGVLNALGFAFCGLLGWVIARNTYNVD